MKVWVVYNKSDRYPTKVIGQKRLQGVFTERESGENYVTLSKALSDFDYFLVECELKQGKTIK